MTLKTIIDSLIRNVLGGFLNQETTYDPQYIKNMIHGFRCMQCEVDYKRNGVINPAYYQRYYLKFDQNLQFSAPQGAVIFSFTPTFNIGNQDGIRYAGTLGGTNSGQPLSMRPCTKQWIRKANRSDLNIMQRHPFTKMENNPDEVYFLLNNSSNTIEVYNNTMLTEGVVEGVFPNPTLVFGYNEDVDDYFLPEDSIPELQGIIYQQRTSIIKATKPYKESDPEFTQERPFKQQINPQQTQQ